jgi:molybdopterin-dependent oxidoreductase alpha subunit
VNDKDEKENNGEAVKDRSPEELSELKVTKPMTIAAGFHAIKETVTNAYAKMGPVRATRSLLKLNQKGGIDCQSCAWPDPDHRTLAEFCESGAKALADEGMSKKITADLFAKYSLEELSEKDDYWLNSQGRLTEPMVARKGSTHYEPISWADAFRLIASELNSLGSPDEAIFYTSGRTSNEAAFLYQLFVRQFGTNNLPDCSNMCHESSGTALTESIGLGKASIRMEDFDKTDLVIVIGQNPGSNAPRMMSSLQDAKRAGAKMIAINPLPEAGLLNFVNPNPQHYRNPLIYPVAVLTSHPATKFADLHLPLRIGGDMAVLKGMMKVMLARELAAPGTVFDHEFINEKTEGYEQFIAGLDATPWEEILRESGLTREQLIRAAEMFINADRVITCWAMGLTQHKKAVATIQDLVNLHLLRGQIGKEGAGVCPVRGHSNVQGDRTMGIWEKVKEDFFVPLEKEFNFSAPRKEGFSTVQSIEAIRDGGAKIFFAMGGNFLSATPDTDVVFDALKKCRLTVQVATKLNRTALATGDQTLILPCLGRSEIDIQASGEQFVSTESTMLNIQMSKGILKPASEELRSEPWIIAQLAKETLGPRTTVDWDKMVANYDNIRDAISRVVTGTENYNELVRKPGGFYLPNPPHEGKFLTKTGKAQFKTSKLERIELKEDQLLLTTIRSHNQFNTTIYDYSDRYRGIEGERRVIFLNPDDIEKHGLKTGQVVNLTSHFDDGERHVYRFIVVPYPIPKGCAAAYFPEANPLVPLGSIAEKSQTPTSKSIIISIQPTSEVAGTFDYDYFQNKDR